jgi:hypothetical protein
MSATNGGKIGLYLKKKVKNVIFTDLKKYRYYIKEFKVTPIPFMPHSWGIGENKQDN